VVHPTLSQEVEVLFWLERVSLHTIWAVTSWYLVDQAVLSAADLCTLALLLGLLVVEMRYWILVLQWMVFLALLYCRRVLEAWNPALFLCQLASRMRREET
jgi:hypothetical protein